MPRAATCGHHDAVAGQDGGAGDEAADGVEPDAAAGLGVDAVQQSVVRAEEDPAVEDWRGGAVRT